jgi:hypothetical protein
MQVAGAAIPRDVPGSEIGRLFDGVWAAGAQAHLVVFQSWDRAGDAPLCGLVRLHPGDELSMGIGVEAGRFYSVALAAEVLHDEAAGARLRWGDAWLVCAGAERRLTTVRLARSSVPGYEPMGEKLLASGVNEVAARKGAPRFGEKPRKGGRR